MTIVPKDIEENMRALERAAAELNEVSDRMTDYVESVNLALKKLNLGVPAWLVIDANGTKFEIGYGKEGSIWGILLRKDHQTWHFRDSPRKLRIEAIDKIPRLLVELNRQAQLLVEQLEQAKVVAQGYADDMQAAHLRVQERKK